MKYLKSYKIFESQRNLDEIARQFIDDLSKIYDLRLGKDFDKEVANCSWFTKEFFEWSKVNGIDSKVVYFDSDTEAHIAPYIDGKVLDFTVKQFTKYANDNWLILTPTDYQKWGYPKFEILDELPELTIRPAEKLSYSLPLAFNEKYGIYDWFEDLKSWEWSRKTLTISDIKKWTEHFIGEGWFSKIEGVAESIIKALQKVNPYDVDMRMYDVYDRLPREKRKDTYLTVAYGNYGNVDKANKHKFNGLIYIKSTSEESKMRIMVHMIKEILMPTLYIGSYPSVLLRRSDESYFVTEKKWQCANFNIKDYEPLGIYTGATGFDDDDWKGRKSTISSYDILNKSKFSAEKVISMYRPCITIDIGGHSDSIQTGEMNLQKLESGIDLALEEILPSLDYEEVIFDKSRGSRMFDTESPIYDYTLKILLKMK